jgi:anti-anti-sigma regulatory factor
MGATRGESPSAWRAPAVLMWGPLTRAEVPARCEAVAAMLLERRTVVVDVTGVITADLVLVDAIARILLLARRLGGTLRVVGVGSDLALLLQLTGLRELLGELDQLPQPCDPAATDPSRGAARPAAERQPPPG